MSEQPTVIKKKCMDPALTTSVMVQHTKADPWLLSSQHAVLAWWITHILCGITIAVGWQACLPAWKDILEFYWLEEPVRDLGRCSKYCLYVCLWIGFDVLQWFNYVLKKSIWNEFLKWVFTSPAKYNHPPRSFWFCFSSVFSCVTAAWACPLKWLLMWPISTLCRRRKGGGFSSPSVDRNTVLKVCSLKVFGCLAKSLWRMQRNSVLSYSINVIIGGSQLLGSRYTVLESGCIIKENI